MNTQMKLCRAARYCNEEKQWRLIHESKFDYRDYDEASMILGYLSGIRSENPAVVAVCARAIPGAYGQGGTN